MTKEKSTFDIFGGVRYGEKYHWTTEVKTYLGGIRTELFRKQVEDLFIAGHDESSISSLLKTRILTVNNYTYTLIKDSIVQKNENRSVYIDVDIHIDGDGDFNLLKYRIDDKVGFYGALPHFENMKAKYCDKHLTLIGVEFNENMDEIVEKIVQEIKSRVSILNKEVKSYNDRYQCEIDLVFSDKEVMKRKIENLLLSNKEKIV